MVIVIGTFAVDPARRDEFLAERLERMRTSRAEAGCLEYTFASDPLDPGRVLLTERGSSRDARRFAPRSRKAQLEVSDVRTCCADRSPPGANPTQSADLVTHILDIENLGDQIAV